MTEYVSEGKPIDRLDAYIREKGGDLLDYYRDFTAWAVFSNDSFLSSYPIVVFDDGIKEIAEKKDIISVSAGGKVSLNIGSSHGAVSEDVFVNVYKMRGTGKNTETPASLANLSVPDIYSIDVQPEDVFYLLAVNASSQNQTFDASVKFDSKEGEEEIIHTFNLKSGYSAKIWAIKIEESGLTLVGNFDVCLDKEGGDCGQELSYLAWEGFNTAILPQGGLGENVEFADKIIGKTDEYKWFTAIEYKVKVGGEATITIGPENYTHYDYDYHQQTGELKELGRVYPNITGYSNGFFTLSARTLAVNGRTNERKISNWEEGVSGWGIPSVATLSGKIIEENEGELSHMGSAYREYDKYLYFGIEPEQEEGKGIFSNSRYWFGGYFDAENKQAFLDMLLSGPLVKIRWSGKVSE